MNTQAEVWQVEVNGQIYETNFDELVQWIYEGSVIREDKVRRGNLRWLEAGRVPKLVSFFNKKDLNIPAEIVPTTTHSENEMPLVSVSFNVDRVNPQNFSENVSQNGFAEQTGDSFSENNFENLVEAPISEEPQINAPDINPNACHFHQEIPPAFVCDSCANLFCGTCPKSYGGTVRTCPLCGSLCRNIAQIQAEAEKSSNFQNEMNEGFGLADFGRALAYPLQYKTSLIAGGIMFMLFTLGQSAGAFGGIYMVFGAIFCGMMANMLTFGILANTINNFSQGLTNRNFMPSFDDFELWNDVIHPFFLSIGVYIVSFGLFVGLMVGMVWFVANSFSSEVDNRKTTLVDRQLEAESKLTPREKEEAEMQRLQNMIEDHRKNQIESVIPAEAETDSEPFAQIFGKLTKFALPFFLLALGTLVWGFFYLPAACLVAGYTRSFTATLNPVNGFDTIRRLGADYFKILLMSVLIVIFSGVISIILNIILKPFQIPFMGNLPAIALGSLSTFYFSIVFSVLLGYALYKNSAKFNFFSR